MAKLKFSLIHSEVQGKRFCLILVMNLFIMKTKLENALHGTHSPVRTPDALAWQEIIFDIMIYFLQGSNHVRFKGDEEKPDS